MEGACQTLEAHLCHTPNLLLHAHISGKWKAWADAEYTSAKCKVQAASQAWQPGSLESGRSPPSGAEVIVLGVDCPYPPWYTTGNSGPKRLIQCHKLELKRIWPFPDSPSKLLNFKWVSRQKEWEKSTNTHMLMNTLTVRTGPRTSQLQSHHTCPPALLHLDLVLVQQLIRSLEPP